MVLPAWPGSTVAVDGATLYVRRAGTPDAPPAVYVHGLGGASTNWTDLMDRLAPHVDGHAVDLPGFGRSGPTRTGRYALDDHVAAVVAYVRHLDRGPVHLLGNSLGGAVSVRLAAERPDLVRTLTLVSPALPQYRLRTADPRLALLLLPGLSRIVDAETARRSPRQTAERVIRLCVYDFAAFPPERLDELTEEMARRRSLPWAGAALAGSLRGLVRSYFEPGPRNLWRQLDRVAAPTLLVHGRADRLVDVSVARVAERRLRDGRLLVLDDAGHIAQIEHPDAVAAAVLDLFDTAEASARRTA